MKQTDNKKSNETFDTSWIFAHYRKLKGESRVHEKDVVGSNLDEKHIAVIIDETLRTGNDIIEELNKRFFEESIKDYRDTILENG